jgi:hypothetical protein
MTKDPSVARFPNTGTAGGTIQPRALGTCLERKGAVSPTNSMVAGVQFELTSIRHYDKCQGCMLTRQPSNQ